MEQTMMCPLCGQAIDTSDMNKVTSIGIRLKLYREAKGLNASQLGRMADVRNNLISQIEKYNRLDAAIRITLVLDVSMDILYGGVDATEEVA